MLLISGFILSIVKCMDNIRVRFAPSPTGALHIGGVRTALYNYLLARKTGGIFILRIEDTDQVRYVPGAEDYIIETLRWCGLIPDEGPGFGGNYGPYRQSDRKAIYQEYADQLLQSGHAYYAFDTPEELEAARSAQENFKYDAATRKRMRNSLSMPASEVQSLLDAGTAHVVRLKVPAGEEIVIHDLIREEVRFQTNELDDKVILKADGMPTYHLANIVDDRLMQITHVIRGEEWLSSTAHHVLLYRAFGWEAEMPRFAHLPLILKPSGKGKLSKRDGVQLGIPVFPLSWKGETEEDSFTGFREAGFLPHAMINFLALLGWNPGNDQEIFSMAELCDAFTLEKIGKAGARFDIDKARWFNQQYIMAMDDTSLAAHVRPYIEAHGHQPNQHFLEAFCGLMKERVVLLPDFWENGYYFFEAVKTYDTAALAKRWKRESREMMEALQAELRGVDLFSAAELHTAIDRFLENRSLKHGDLLPLLRIALAGTMKGPAVFEMMALLGKEESLQRLKTACGVFDDLIAAV